MNIFKRQTKGSVICPGCHRLVGVNEEKCYHCGRPSPGMWGYTSVLRRLGQDFGFAQIVIGGCIILYVLTLLVYPANVQSRGLMSFLAPSQTSLLLFGASGSIPLFQAGRWWTVISAAWLHGGLLHILFNMMWIRSLAPVTADTYGIGRTVIIYTVSSITGFFLSSWIGMFSFLPWPLRGAELTVGASAPIFGLLGALVYSGRRGIGSALGRQALHFAIILGAFGLLMPSIDNWAHLGGFAGGYFVAQWLDPLEPERTDHQILALACFGLVILSIVISVLHGLQFM
ncbi:MAG: rhomboid family intramembrane serine protease [Acidobacteriota bacterium]|nr:rhomboid family intramembrane serine protease [Acidobacteriota bacterium]